MRYVPRAITYLRRYSSLVTFSPIRSSTSLLSTTASTLAASVGARSIIIAKRNVNWLIRPFSELAQRQSLPFITSSSIAVRYNTNSNGEYDWTPPQRVSSIDEIVSDSDLRGDGCHWLVFMNITGVEVATEEELLDLYTKTLASAVGREDEARKRIYLVSYGCRFGFGANINLETKSKLEVCPGVQDLCEDHYYEARVKDDRVDSDPTFTTLNRNDRLNDIFSYHHLSEQKSKWDSDHWLINTKKPNEDIISEQQAFDFYIKMLAEVVGSEEVARKKIYIVWCKSPFGFGAEIDWAASNKLKGRADVLIVLPDYAFDVKNSNHGVLVISPSSLTSYPCNIYFYPLKLDPPEDSDDSDSYDRDSEDSNNNNDSAEDTEELEDWDIVTMETEDSNNNNDSQVSNILTDR